MEDLNNSLKEARKAYRLLALYQKRILDLVKHIGKQYNFKIDFGKNKVTGNYSTQTKKINDAGNGAIWNWLDLYYYLFRYEPQTYPCENNENYTISFYILIVSDTGYLLRNNKTQKKIEDFEDVQKSDTKIILIAAKDQKKIAPYGNLFDNNDNDDTKFKISSGQKEFIKDNIIGKAYSLDRFKDAESTKTSLEKFAELCDEKLSVNLFKERLQESYNRD